MKTVTIKQIQEVIDPKARWIARDKNGSVRWYIEKPIQYNANKDYCSPRISGALGKIKVAEFEGKDWTECCVELEPDYSEWIGKLCWFWNADGAFEEMDYEDVTIGNLTRIRSTDEGKQFKDIYSGTFFAHCRPVKPEEVEFVK